MMIDSSPKNDFEQILVESETHFSRATEIWNSFGVTSPQLQIDAARTALAMYERAAELLDVNHIAQLPLESRVQVLAFRERILAQVATMKHYSSSDYTQKITQLEDALEHFRRAEELLNESNSNDENRLFRLRMDALHTEGHQQMLRARVAAREHRNNEAIAHYKSAESKFIEQMNSYERRSADLKSVRSTIEQSLEHEWKNESNVEITDMHARIIVMRFEEPYQPLSDEDMYRRAAANLYSSCGSRCNLEALEAFEQHRPLPEIEDKLTESIKFVCWAMEAVPANLEFHRDLINAWKIKGERFGCPLIETESAFHTNCPIAIKELAGKWYISPTFEYDGLTCVVCGKDILECPHLPGEEIDGQIVRYQRQNLRITSVSLVDIPEDPRCRIEWLSLPKDRFPRKARAGDQLRCFICQSNPNVEVGGEENHIFSSPSSPK
jgi:hypothetical protein